MRKRYTDEERERFLTELASSGEQIREVAGRVGVDLSTAYRWRRGSGSARRKKVTRAKTAFARLVRTPRTTTSRKALVLEVGAASVRIESDFDPELLRAVVAALGNGST